MQAAFMSAAAPALWLLQDSLCRALWYTNVHGAGVLRLCCCCFLGCSCSIVIFALTCADPHLTLPCVGRQEHSSQPHASKPELPPSRGGYSLELQ